MCKDNYDDFFVMPANNISVQSIERIRLFQDIVSQLPAEYKAKAKENSFDLYNELLNSSVLYRKNSKSSDALSILWLSQVRKKASIIASKMNDKVFMFNEKKMQELALLSYEESNILKIQKCLFNNGIILLYNNEIKGLKLDGASFLLDSGIPVIGMSLRYDRLDYYWFTLMHELAHIVLHREILKTPHLDAIDDSLKEDIEEEANGLAQKSLIPRYVWREFTNLSNIGERKIREVAKEAHIHPSILAGRYMMENARYDVFSTFVNQYKVKEMLL